MIEKIFYEEIIPECSSKKLVVGDFRPTVFFDVNILGENTNTFFKDEINPKPIIVINNKEEFNRALNEYVLAGINFYYDGAATHDNIKSLIVYVFSNATSEDLVDPVPFLKLRKNFFDYIPSDKSIKKEVLGYDGKITINKLRPYLEAPLSFEFEINSEEHTYALPNIIFGINNETAYIYAIQNKFLGNNPLRKKINRQLFKINADFTDDSDSEIFNARDVSMPFVASVIIFIDYLKYLDIEKIIVPVNMPIRYNSHFESYKRRIDYAMAKYTDDEFLNYKNKLEKENAVYGDNTTMKLIRTFNRVSSAGNVLKIKKYPFIGDSKMYLSINKEGNFYNDFCNELYTAKSKNK